MRRENRSEQKYRDQVRCWGRMVMEVLYWLGRRMTRMELMEGWEDCKVCNRCVTNVASFLSFQVILKVT